MTISQSTKTADASPARDLLYASRYYLGGWRGLLVLAVIAALIGVGFSWSWLVAAGIAPILLSTVPCLIMCGLGLCMLCRSGEKQTTASGDAVDVAISPPAPRTAKMDRSSGMGSKCCQDGGGETQSPRVTQVQSIEERRESHA